jgi:hypothetical protein
MDAGIPSRFKALRPPGGGALRAALSRLVLRLKLQPSIPQGESPPDAPIIGGDTRPRTLVMGSSGFAGFPEVPINEPVRGTPWNHQRACAVTPGRPPLVETFSFKSRDFANLGERALEKQLRADASEALAYYGETLDIRRPDLERRAEVQRVRLIYEGGKLKPTKVDNLGEVVSRV